MWNVSLTLSLTTVMPVNLHCRYHLQQINFSLVDGVVVPYLFRFSNADFQDFWILKITISTSLYASSLLARRHWPKYFVVTNSLHYLFPFLIIFSDGCIRHDELYFSCSMRAAIFHLNFGSLISSNDAFQGRCERVYCLIPIFWYSHLEHS